MLLHYIGVLLILISSSVLTETFCIYNHFMSDNINVDIAQENNYGGSYWQRFRAMIPGGGSACCNYKEKSCNKDGAIDTVTSFAISIRPSPTEVASFTEIDITSGGYANIGGNPLNPDIKVFDANGDPFGFTGSL